MKRSLWLGILAAVSLASGLSSVPAHATGPERSTAKSRAGVAAVRTQQPAARGGPIGAVTLGRVASSGTAACFNGSSGEGYAWMSNFVDPSNPSYTTPYAGVVTSFSNYSSAVTGRLQALFFVPSGVEFHYNLAQKSDPVTVGANRLNTFPARIRVDKGEILAMRTIDPNLRCLGDGLTIDQIAANSFTATQTTFDFSGTPLSQTHKFVDISATLEPDVDDDGYGDVSQDGCPQLAAVHDPCPAPAVTVTKAPPRKSSKHKAKVRFTSNLAGSTFACSVDGRAFKACHSPYKGHFPLGTHTLRIIATSPVGVAAQPVTVQFKVVKPKA